MGHFLSRGLLVSGGNFSSHSLDTEGFEIWALNLPTGITSHCIPYNITLNNRYLSNGIPVTFGNPQNAWNLG